MSDTRTMRSIQPPPSVDDLLALAADARVGQVDFATTLTAEPEPEDAPLIEPTPISRRRPVMVGPAGSEPDTTPKPIEPAEAVATRPTPASRGRESQIESVSEPVSEPVAEPASFPIPTILPVAQLDPTQESGLRMPVEDEPAPAPMPAPAAAAAPAATATGPGDLGLSVQEVADAAIERLRDAENATLRHLAALEAEALRRAELLTAQAELDAELIRLTARREALAIVSAARTRAGDATPPGREARQLSEISDAVSRFAESMEASVAPLRSSAESEVP